MASVFVRDGHFVDEARHDQPCLEPQLVRFALPLRCGPSLAARRKQDRVSERLQDEDFDHHWCLAHALWCLHLILEQSVLQVSSDSLTIF